MADWTDIFNANATPGDPSSYAAQQLRQRIALQMLARDSKKGYPKTLGEGLTAIGDALGERGQMRTLLDLQNQIDAKRTKEMGSPDTPQRTSEAVDTTDTVPVRTAAVEPSDAAQPEGPTAQPVPQTRALPPVATVPPTSTAVPMARQAQEVNAATPYFPTSQGFPTSTAPRLDPTVTIGTDPNFTPAPSTGPTTQAEAAPWLRDQSAVAGIYRPRTTSMPPLGGPTDQERAAGLNALRAKRSDAGDYAYPQTAALQTGDTMSDAPPIGIAPGPRDSITKSIMQATAQGVPQLNPMQAGPTAPTIPTTLGAITAGSPSEAANNPAIPTSIAPRPAPGAQMAQASMTQPQPLTPQPTPPVQASGIYDRPIPPVKPPPEPKSSAQTALEQKALRNEGLGGDPALTTYWKGQAALMEAERARKEAFTMKQYENQLTEHGAADRAWVDAQRNMGKTQAETSEAQAKALEAKDAAVLTERTGLPAKQVTDKFDVLKKGAEKDAYTIQQLRLAREALDKGIVSGIGGEFRLNLERAKAFFGNAPANELAARSQLYLAAVNSTVGNALQNLQPGDPRVTNSDVIVARGMMGGDPTLQKAAQEKLLGVQMGDVHKRINEYEGLKDQYLKGWKGEKFYDVQFDPLHNNPDVTKAWTDKLIKNQDSYAARERFDKEFGPGSAELEIARARRRGRQ